MFGKLNWPNDLRMQGEEIIEETPLEVFELPRLLLQSRLAIFNKLYANLFVPAFIT